MDRFCSECRDAGGYRLVRCRDARGGYYEALAPCAHEQAPGLERAGSQLAAAATRLAAAEAALTPADREVARVLMSHVGRAQAIRAADLAVGIFEGADDPARREEVRRAVTQSIERLRTLAHMPIAATKEPPYGYFLPQTQAEWDEMHERYMRELVRLARLARLFRPDADIVQRLRGQLEFASK